MCTIMRKKQISLKMYVIGIKKSLKKVNYQNKKLTIYRYEFNKNIENIKLLRNK